MSSDSNPKSKQLQNQLFDLYEESLTSHPNAEITHPLFHQLSQTDQDYDVKESIAKGGMKTIFKAIHLKSQRVVAMAKLHENTPEELFDPFIREARLTSLLDHPNIIKVYDLGIDESHQPFFTMELKMGKTLEDHLQKKELDLPQKLMLFFKVCDALAYAHSKHILHLDIKPSNIQVGSYGEVLVCDWGLGRIINDELDDIHNELLHPDLLNHMTMGSEIKGTPGYMAPEQVLCHDKSLCTDIYSLGVLLRTILLEAPPEGNSADELLQKTKGGHWPAPSLINNKLPKSLDGVVHKAMALNPNERYQNVPELKHDVERVLNNFSPSTEQSHLIRELTLFYKRHQKVCLISSAFLLFILVLSLFFTNQLKQSRDIALAEKVIAQKHAREAELLSETLEKEKAQVQAISIDLIDTYIAGSSQFSDDLIYDTPVVSVENGLEALDKVHQISKDHEWANMQKGYLNFLRLNFVEAKHHFNIFSDRCEDLEIMCEDLAKTFPTVDQSNSIDALKTVVQLLAQTTSRVALVDKMLSYEIEKHGYREEIIEVVHTFVQMLNPELKFLFDYDKKRQVLRITKELKSLYVNEKFKSALRHIPIKRLILKTPKFKKLESLNDLPYLEVLDIVSLEKPDLSLLPNLPQLKSIILNKENHQNIDLHSLSKQINLQFQ